MAIVAVPVYRRRVAPVFDSSLKVLLVNLNHDLAEARTELLLEGFSQAARVEALSKAGVTTLICEGISEALHAMLEDAGVCVFWGVVGPVDEVLEAFASNRLNEPRFHMPGHESGYVKHSGRSVGVLQENPNED